MELELNTAFACDNEHATTSSSSFLSVDHESVVVEMEYGNRTMEFGQK
jgi:hypothetical protein